MTGGGEGAGIGFDGGFCPIKTMAPPSLSSLWETLRWGAAQKVSFLLACCFMTSSGGERDAHKKRGLKMSWIHFKEGDINEKLIDEIV